MDLQTGRGVAVDGRADVVEKKGEKAGRSLRVRLRERLSREIYGPKMEGKELQIDGLGAVRELPQLRQFFGYSDMFMLMIAELIVHLLSLHRFALPSLVEGTRGNMTLKAILLPILDIFFVQRASSSFFIKYWEPHPSAVPVETRVTQSSCM